MAIASQLLQLFLALRRRLLQPFKPGSTPRTLRQILGWLAFIWSILRNKFGFREREIAKPPSTSQDDNPSRTKTRRTVIQPQHTEQAENSQLEPKSISCTLTEQGEIISLDDVALSAYPFPGNIRATRSTQSLSNSHRSHRSARNIATTMATNASRSSQHLGSEHSYHSGNSNYSNSIYGDGRTKISPYLNQPSRDFPARQQTAPTRHHHVSMLDLEVKSPIGNAEVDSLRIPTTTSVFRPVFRALGNPRILPKMPEYFASCRYDDRLRMRKKRGSMTIEAMKTDFSNPIPPFGWVKCVHPEGARYFCDYKKQVYTDADLYDPKILLQTNEDVEAIRNSSDSILSESTVIVLHVFYAEDEGHKDLQTIYHLADHERRVVFFLDDVEAEELNAWWEVSNVTSETHLRCEIEAQYWYFINLFPHALELSSPMIAELRDITLFFIGDLMTSSYSIAPFTSAESYNILTLSSEMESNVGKVDVGSIGLLARLMFVYYHTRFLNFHGEASSRIERNFSIYGDPLHRRTLLIKTLSLFLFSAPDFHLKVLQDMVVDGITHIRLWKEVLVKLDAEWQQFVLLATVMLNANVAFLSIQSVDINTGSHRSPAQICSYLSSATNIGCIILGLLLLRQYRTKDHAAGEVWAVLAARYPQLSLETLAILYSLPYALLIWGILSFLAAFCFLCFQDSSLATRSLVGPTCAVIAILVGWCVWTCWKKREEEAPIPPFADEEEPVADVSNSKSGLSTEKKETRPSLLNRFMNLPSVRKDIHDTETVGV